MDKREDSVEMTELQPVESAQPAQEQARDALAAMRSYLREKYGEFDYEIISYEARSWTQDYDTLYGSVRQGEQADSFRVERHGDEGSYSYQDSYFGILVREELERYISEQAEKFYSTFRVIATPEENCYPEDLTADSGLADLIAHGQELPYITFFVFTADDFSGQKDFEDKGAAFAAGWAESGLPATVRVVRVNADELEGIDRGNYGELLAQALADGSLQQFTQTVGG